MTEEPGKFFEELVFIKLIDLDDFCQRAKLCEVTTHARGLPADKKIERRWL